MNRRIISRKRFASYLVPKFILQKIISTITEQNTFITDYSSKRSKKFVQLMLLRNISINQYWFCLVFPPIFIIDESRSGLVAKYRNSAKFVKVWPYLVSVSILVLSQSCPCLLQFMSLSWCYHGPARAFVSKHW